MLSGTMFEAMRSVSSFFDASAGDDDARTAASAAPHRNFSPNPMVPPLRFGGNLLTNPALSQSIGALGQCRVVGLPSEEVGVQAGGSLAGKLSSDAFWISSRIERRPLPSSVGGRCRAVTASSLRSTPSASYAGQ